VGASYLRPKGEEKEISQFGGRFQSNLGKNKEALCLAIEHSINLRRMPSRKKLSRSYRVRTELEKIVKGEGVYLCSQDGKRDLKKGGKKRREVRFIIAKQEEQ